MKKIFVFLSLTVIGLSIMACSGESTNDIITRDLIEFTIEDLSQYDGLEGREAYIAVDGFVYDVSDSGLWRDGLHQGQVQAGQDLTDELDSISPHGREMLDRVPKIGVIVDAITTTEEVTTEIQETSTESPTTQEGVSTDQTTTNSPISTTIEVSTDSMRTFTVEELATYDGLDGRDAYIAVDGIVYDVSDSSLWTDGNHQGRVQAGQDLTDEIDTISPHGRRVLDNIPIIGSLEE